MERFLFCDFADELQCGADIVGGNIVFTLDLLKSHTAGKTADHHRDRYTRSADDWFSVTDRGIDNDSF